MAYSLISDDGMPRIELSSTYIYDSFGRITNAFYEDNLDETNGVSISTEYGSNLFLGIGLPGSEIHIAEGYTKNLFTIFE